MKGRIELVSYQQAKLDVERLVNEFSALSLKDRKSYNEAATRQQFILPLFEALGWNTRNAREVAPEENVSRGRVDFAFRLNGVPRFFLETKRVHEDLDDPRWANQAITYSWLKGVTWAVLSNFEELKIFNAEWQETIPARAIFKHLHWEEYLENFDELMLLSKEAVLAGVIDREAEKVGKKIKKTAVDKKLFQDLATWRHELFRHLRPYNPLWSVKQVDEAVQRILNRLIFIRTVEDRLIEEQRLIPLLREWESKGHKGNLVTNLSELFRELNDSYNSGLFAPHFSENAESEPAPYIKIIEGLHELPGGYGFYDFSAIGADVLGTIYEQYLGYIAQNPDATEVVSKRGKRKQQGIFYTPRFVVKYIVQNTLGRMLEKGGLDFALNIKVLDPACGSGSFLLEAFDVLDNFVAHERGEIIGENPKADADRRKHILANNLYGVDLDTQAVEITKLNLWLRSVANREHLPHLPNIRQGNSLVDDKDLAGDTAFSWKREFPEIFEKGGFDIVIGNPPYGMLQPHNADRRLLEYLNANFKVASFKIDIFHLFMEKCLDIARNNSYIGLIVPNTFITNVYTDKLRNMITDECKILEIAVSSEQLFPDAEVNNAIIVLQKENEAGGRQANSIAVALNVDELFLTNDQSSASYRHTIRQEDLILLSSGSWNIKLSDQSVSLFRRIQDNSDPLASIAKVNRGLITGDRDKYISKSPKSEKWLPIITGTDVNRYFIEPAKEYVYFEKPPNAGGTWNPKVHLSSKIVVRQIGYYPIASYDENPYCVTGNIFTIKPVELYAPHYILGILNSKFTQWLWQLLYGDFKAIFPELKGIYLEQFPIRHIDFDSQTNKAHHDNMVKMVQQMLVLQKDLMIAETMLEDRRHKLKQEVELLDAQIDLLVYELYGLSDDEIALIEANG
ncbi:MAG: N-6 DNA methylase [Chloroflexi bacterium]|nr:hypothetical protein [Chloroflexota bacterium]NOG62258.1 N-6 DNA methylase [Chloroflexota bacterium]